MKKILSLTLTACLVAMACPAFAQHKTDKASPSTPAPRTSPEDSTSGCVCSCGECCGSCRSMAAYAAIMYENAGSAKTPSESAKAEDSGKKSAETETYHLALRANLLRWATLTPDLGLEWRVNRNVGILVDGSYTSWSWKGGDRRYALWEVNPEARWYVGESRNCYVGAMFKAGAFSYKFSDTGKQGNLLGGGVTGGYVLNLNGVLSLDFSLGLGYVRADFDEYSVVDGMYLRDGQRIKNWWGPTKAGVTLVWKIF